MSRAGPSRPRPSGRNAKHSAKGKNKATAIEVPDSPISVHSTDAEEDEFEEVEIPGSGGGAGSSSLPGTPIGASIVGTSFATSLGGSLGDSGTDDDSDEERREPQVIRLELGGETEEDKAKQIALAMRKKPITAKDRALRLEVHKMHVIGLLASTRIRNRWANNTLLQARLLSLLPHPLQAAFTIPPKRFPDRAQRSRLFFEALQSLVTWWSQDFFDISDRTLGLRTRTWDEVQGIIDRHPRLSKDDFIGGMFARKIVKPESKKGKGKGKAKDEYVTDNLRELADEFGGERLRTVNSMMKKALQQEGSRDVSAQLFVALARACGLGARLVVSIQAVPWRAEKPVAKQKNGGGRSMAARQGMGGFIDSAEDELEEVAIPDPDNAPSTPSTPSGSKSRLRGAGNRRPADPADLYRLRKVKPPPQTVGSKPKRPKKHDMTEQPPVFWAEVFNRSDQRWIPVDPVSGVIRKKALYEPSSDSGPVRLIYVVAFEEDGYARDVTLRYTKSFSAKTCKLRPPAPKPGETDWWTEVTGFMQRPTRLNRDDLEDAELEMSQFSEGMPHHMSGFKDHPMYVLERHLKQTEVILPKREVGRFKGEAVYRRANVLACKTAENWMRIGRQIRGRQEPLKYIKQRAVTIQKRRAQELANLEGAEPLQQGLYAEYQTELYRPPPIQNGIIPQNAFGNIDLYVPTMLPEGAAHLPYKGIAKVAKQLGISYAEAVTSFEFKKQRALPVITGIVVAEENEETVLEAYWESAAAAEEREKARREDRALKRWKKLINGIRVRLRLRAEYGTGEELDEEHRNPMANPAGGGPGQRSAMSVISAANQESMARWAALAQGRDATPEAEPEPDADPEPEGQAAPEPSPLPTAPAVRPETPESPPALEPGPAPEPAPVPERETTRSGRPKRAVTKANGNGSGTPKIVLKFNTPAATPPPPSKSQRKGKQKATTGSANGRTRSTRGRKRKAESDESDALTSADELTPPPRARKAAPAPAPTRTLRSRTAKNEAQLKAEEEKAARMRAALASDEEDEDDE